MESLPASSGVVRENMAAMHSSGRSSNAAILLQPFTYEEGLLVERLDYLYVFLELNDFYLLKLKLFRYN
jgi:hypothetical protein